MSVAPSSPWKAYLALTFGVLCIGLSAIFVKIAAAPGVVSAFYRVFFASLVLVPLWLLRRPQLPPQTVLRATLLGGVFFATDLVLWNASLLLTGAGVATLLANNAPLWCWGAFTGFITAKRPLENHPFTGLRL